MPLPIKNLIPSQRLSTASPLAAGLLRESVLHRYAQYCNLVREGTYEVISAYRSPKTNEMLRGRSNGIAKNRQHLLGKAVDVRLTDVELTKLCDTAISMKRGGIGYYASSNFVHIDTGRVRRW